MKAKTMLYFSPGRNNSKLQYLEKLTGKRVYTFSLLSGHTCPYARDCQSKVVVNTEGQKRIVDGMDTVFRCFSASQEALFPAVYNQRKHNTETILPLAAKSVDDAAILIQQSIPVDAGIIRIHVGGDFKTQAYFDAWLTVAVRNPNILFYAYTKSLPFWIKRLSDIPPNFILTASVGGYKDSLIEKHSLRFARVVATKAEAKRYKLTVDINDSIAALPENRHKNIGLLIHGVQPAGTKYSKIVHKNKGKKHYGIK